MKRPKADDDSPVPLIAPPNTFTVDYERKPVLYRADGTPLVKRPAGFQR